MSLGSPPLEKFLPENTAESPSGNLLTEGALVTLPFRLSAQQQLRGALRCRQGRVCGRFLPSQLAPERLSWPCVGLEAARLAGPERACPRGDTGARTGREPPRVRVSFVSW